jgi:hydroxymethylpyrimidine/phosphomethylpyrimidine kinase
MQRLHSTHPTMNSQQGKRPVVLAIAGSDPSGGAGIQADLKTFEAMGVYGMAIPAALTAQNSASVAEVWPVSTAKLERQVEMLQADFRIDAVKIGLLGSASNARWLARWLWRNPGISVVIDPVLRASGGSGLTTGATFAAMREHLIGRATVLAPNLPEAEALLERPIGGRREMPQAARELLALGCAAVLLKGGHLARGAIEDTFADVDRTESFEHPRLPHTAHGTGCALSSALAARLALGDAPFAAAQAAVAYVHRALAGAFNPGGCRTKVLAHRNA